MAVSPNNFGLMGFVFPVVDSDDCPDESDVRYGVSYCNGHVGTYGAPPDTDDARLVQFAEALVTAIQIGWSGGSEPGSVTTVTRRWVSRETDNDLKSLSGRKVWVFPTGYGDETLTRGLDHGEYRATIDVVRKYDVAGNFDADAFDSWVDDEVKFVQDYIWDALSDPRATEILSGYYPNTGAVSIVVDEAMLAQNKVFWSRSELIFKAIQPT